MLRRCQSRTSTWSRQSGPLPLFGVCWNAMFWVNQRSYRQQYVLWAQKGIRFRQLLWLDVARLPVQNEWSVLRGLQKRLPPGFHGGKNQTVVPLAKEISVNDSFLAGIHIFLTAYGPCVHTKLAVCFLAGACSNESGHSGFSGVRNTL